MVHTEKADLYQPLFNHMSSEHGLTLTMSEMDEIMNHCDTFRKAVNKQAAAAKGKRSKKYVWPTRMEFDAWIDNEDFESAWIGYNEMRVKQRKHLTNRAANVAFNNLFRLSGGNMVVAIPILDQSTDHCWPGIYPLKDQQVNSDKNLPKDASSYNNPEW